MNFSFSSWFIVPTVHNPCCNIMYLHVVLCGIFYVKLKCAITIFTSIRNKDAQPLEIGDRGSSVEFCTSLMVCTFLLL